MTEPMKECPDCKIGYPYFDRRTSFMGDSVFMTSVRAVCAKCEWSTGYHETVRGCLAEWNNTVLEDAE
jgi:hypothetical protein